MMDEPLRPKLLVLASTYPRWRDDVEPGFVHELSKRLTGDFAVTALVPDAPGADSSGDLEGVQVIRYRYAPRRLQTLVNDGGIVTNLRLAPWKWLLVPGFLIGGIFRTWRVVRRLKPDVVHAHWMIPQGLVLVLLRALGCRVGPFLLTSHGADLFVFRSKPLQGLKRFVLHRASAITVVSEAMRQAVARLAPDVSAIVQPMGVDMRNRFTPSPEVVRSKSEILFVGRLVEKKGVRHLIDALPSVLKAWPNATLTIAGFGPEEPALRRQVQRLNLSETVRFVGAVAQRDLPLLYRRATVFVAPFVEAASGDQEGLGLVSVEAAACGCPVILSDIPGVRDVIDAVTRIHAVQPGSPSELSFALCKVLQEAEITCGRSETEDFQRLRQLFDWDSVSARYSTILRSIAARAVPEGVEPRL